MHISFECKYKELELLLLSIDFEDKDFALSSFLLVGLRSYLDYCNELKRKDSDYEKFKKFNISGNI